MQSQSARQYKKPKPTLRMTQTIYRWILTALGDDPQSRLKHISEPNQSELFEVDKEEFRSQASDQFSPVKVVAAQPVPTIPDLNSSRHLSRLSELGERPRVQASDHFSRGEAAAVQVVPTILDSNSPRPLPRLPELDQRLSEIQLIASPSEELFEPERQHRRESFNCLVQLSKRLAS